MPGSGQDVVGTERTQRDGDLGQRSGIGREAGTQVGERWQAAGVEALVDQGGEIGLDAPLVGDGERTDDELAGGPFRQSLHGRVVEPAVGFAREELVAIDEARQCAGLGPQRMDDVAIVDDMAAPVGTVAAAALQGGDVCAAEKTSTRSSWRRTRSRWPIRREGTV